MGQKEQLFERMTSVGMVYVILSQVTQMALDQSLTEDKLLQHERGALQISGMIHHHPSERSYLAPLILSFFSEMKTWLKAKTNGQSLLDFTKMFNSEISKTYEEKYEPLQLDGMTPRWHQQVLEVGSQIMKKEPISPEQIGSLFRNIPADTTYGYLATIFLEESMAPSTDDKKLNLWWSFLSGQKPFICKVEQRGLFSFVDFLPSNQN